MKKQALNPYLPGYEYVPDGEPHLFDGRVYIYGSHDKFNGEKFCMNDYVCWSASVQNLAEWKYEGVIYRKTQEPINADAERNLFVPDVAKGPDGRYYLYYSMLGTVSVAVCDTPAGEYSFYAYVQHPNGAQLGRQKGDNVNFDPAILVDKEDVYLYSGVVPNAETQEMIKQGGLMAGGAYCIQLQKDMKTIKAPPVLVVPAEGEDYAGHVFFEASSIRKIGGLYYFVYSSQNGHELCYATCNKANGRFAFGGTLVSNGDIFLNGIGEEQATNYTGNTHGGLLQIGEKTYIFYHRQTNLHHFSRQGCAEEVHILPGGKIKQVEITSCGLNGGPLRGSGKYMFATACNLASKSGACFYPHKKMEPGIHPYFTQDKPDGSTDAVQYIANFQDGAKAGFKYFAFDTAKNICVVYKGNAQGELMVYGSSLAGLPLASLPLCPAKGWGEVTGAFCQQAGVQPLYFTFKGEGSADLLSFTLL